MPDLVFTCAAKCRGDKEGVSAFLARLRKLAKPCRLSPGVLEEMLQDRLVCGIKHERLQSRLLSEPHLTLQLAVELAQAHESAAASAAELSGHEAGVSNESTVHQVGRARGAAGGAGARRGPLRPASAASPPRQLPERKVGGPGFQTVVRGPTWSVPAGWEATISRRARSTYI